MIADWDDAYANAIHIPGGEFWPDMEAPVAFRRAFPPNRLREGIAYGRDPRDRIDLFLPEGRPAGLLVFVHGGYWFKFDRGVWSQYAAGALGRGWAVAMPGYVLAPEARIAAITRSVAAAIQQAAELVEGPHGAGGAFGGRASGDAAGLRGQRPARRGAGPDAGGWSRSAGCTTCGRCWPPR